MTKLTWHFPTTDGGEEDGINDPGIETFEGNHERFVARESIQNSIDARKDKKQPARVHFERCDIPLAEIPGLDELRGVIERSQEYSKNQENSSQLYGEASRKLKQKKVKKFSTRKRGYTPLISTSISTQRKNNNQSNTLRKVTANNFMTNTVNLMSLTGTKRLSQCHTVLAMRPIKREDNV